MGDYGNASKCCGSFHCPGISIYWKKIYSFFICGSTGTVPKRTVKGIAVASTVIGIFEAVLGLWLAVITIRNGTLPLKTQLHFRHRGPTSIGEFFVNESPFMETPLSNLSFYLYSMATIAFLAGLGRIIMSIFLFIYVRKNAPSNAVFYGWAIITVLSLGSLFVISFDTLKTLGMSFDITETAPPHKRDFHFTNDSFGFYYLCYIYKWGIITDVIVTLYCLCVVKMYFYEPSAFRSTGIATGNA